MGKKGISDLKIMLVDDVATFRDVLVQLLKDMGITKISEASNGAEAWDKILLESKGFEEYDLVISDINMPQMSGIELLKNAKEYKKTSKIPFILVSTENEKTIILQAILLGISDYLIKPYDVEMASKKIQMVLAKILYP